MPLRLFWPILAQVAPDPVGGGALIQYGALGFMALVLIAAVRVLWTRQQAQYDAEREAHEKELIRLHEQVKTEVTRGDRLETELLTLHKFISSELSGNLVRSTEAMKETADLLRYRGER